MITLETFISIIAPHACVGCRAEGSLLCSTCEMDGIPALPDRCYRCLSLAHDSRVCAACRKQSALRHVWVRTSYDGIARELVSRMKFARAKKATEIIGMLAAEALPHFSSNYIVVPLPTAAVRVRQRGYDHAERISHTIALTKNMRQQCLLRRSGGARQVGASRQQRLSQLRGAFYVPDPKALRGRDILLVDDILTTGGSIEEAARVLRAAGARSVSASIFAQKAVTFAG
jgi:ComF family protein